MSKKKVFISFDYDNDRKWKNLLVAWDKNEDFDFDLYDASLKVAINSEDAKYIKSQIKPKIKAADYLLCIVGAESASSDWIRWEIQTAIDEGKALIGVKTDKSNKSPLELLNNGSTWAMSFTLEAIRKAVDDA